MRRLIRNVLLGLKRCAKACATSERQELDEEVAAFMRTMMSSTKAFVKTGKLDHASVQCVGDRILVRRDEKEDTSRGGIALPEAAKQKPSKGTIVSVGPGKILDSGIRKEPQVKEGDRVLFGRWSGTEHPDDEMLVFIREDDIQAVI